MSSDGQSVSTRSHTTADALIAALQNVPAGALLVKNQVGNFAALTEDGDYVGYLDIGHAEYVDVTEEEDPA